MKMKTYDWHLAYVWRMKIEIYLGVVGLLFCLFITMPIVLGTAIAANDPLHEPWIVVTQGVFIAFMLTSIPGWCVAWKLMDTVSTQDGLASYFYLSMMVCWIPFGGPLALFIWGRKLRK